MQSLKPSFGRLAISLLIASVGATAATAAERGPIQATTIAPERSVASATQLVFSPDENGRVGESQVSPADRDGRYLFIVRFAEPSIARYEGGIDGFAATSPRATGQRLNMRSNAVQAYRGFLEARQSENLDQMSRFVQRSVEPTHQFLNALNGVAVRLTPKEAELVAGLPFVAGIEIDRLDELHTDEGPALIGAPDFWDGMVTSGVGNRGEGVIIGIMDSGFNHGHPSFAEVASDGYEHTNPYGDGVFVGVCADPGAEDYEDVCNNKLIGAYSIAADSVTAEDTAASGHGTHVGSTAGGNPLTVSIPC